MAQHASTAVQIAAGLSLAAAAAAAGPAIGQELTKTAAPTGAPKVMQLTEEQCAMFKRATLDVIRVFGRANLSDDFVNAMVDFGVRKKCVGPADIPARGQDIAALNTVRSILLSSNVSLEQIGVRGVKQTASLGLGTN